MIPKIIHYCWFGRGEMPQLALDCIASWHKYMPDWEYRIWNEDNFDVNSNVYCREAYQAKKYAFVTDYVRLVALEKEGGLYLDTDVEVFKTFEPLLQYHAFAGFEGSKHQPIGTCVLATEPHGIWVTEQLADYDSRHFIKDDGSMDLTTNVNYISSKMRQQGFLQNGQEQDYKDLHIFPVDYFSPRHTTGEYIRTSNTFSEHKCFASWSDSKCGWKNSLRRIIGQRNMTRLIKLKRKLIG